MNTTYNYGNLSRLLSVTHATGGATLDGAASTVDNDGNRLTRTPLPTGMASSFGYDNIYELLSVTQGGTATESYTYECKSGPVRWSVRWRNCWSIPNPPDY